MRRLNQGCRLLTRAAQEYPQFRAEWIVRGPIESALRRAASSIGTTNMQMESNIMIKTCEKWAIVSQSVPPMGIVYQPGSRSGNAERRELVRRQAR